MVVMSRLSHAVACLVLAAASLSCSFSDADSASSLGKIELPPGFSISIYAEGLENPRGMVLGDEGTLFVGSRKTTKVYAVVDKDQDYRADAVHIIMDTDQAPDGQKLRMPSGVAFKDGALYVGAISHILRFDDIEKRLKKPGKPAIVSADYPSAAHHGWKFIAFGPGGKLYAPVGAPCNICERDDEMYASMTRINADGTGREIIAKGIRNTVGFAWHPETGELWFTDNGVDSLGDDFPGDELNRMSRTGLHFGFPHVHQGDTLDQRFGQGRSVDEFTPPARVLGAHVAALGMRFYTGDMFPSEYKNQIFIAEHGSWNRSSKSGYRITLVRLEGNEVVSYEPFAEGWLEGEENWGRPADLLILPDGSMLVSDSIGNVIYRITYEG